MKVDYSLLVEALQKHNKEVYTEELEELYPRLITYLRVSMDASPEDAEDAAQEALAKTYKRIMEGEVKAAKYFFKYILQACRNEYLMAVRTYNNRRTGTPGDVPGYLVTPSEQIKKLVEEERKKLMRECIDSMKENYRDILWYYCNETEWDPKKAGHHFSIRPSNARARKTRAIKKLGECVKKKLAVDELRAEGKV